MTISTIDDLASMPDPELRALVAKCGLETIAYAVHGVDTATKRRLVLSLSLFRRLKLRAMRVYREAIPLASVEAAHEAIVAEANRP